MFHNIYNFFFLTLQTRAIAQLSYGSKVKLEKLALIVQWIERRFPKPLIRVRFPVGVLNVISYPLPCKREESDYHFLYRFTTNNLKEIYTPIVFFNPLLSNGETKEEAL